MVLKYGLHADKMNLCALIVVPSHASVTSARSSVDCRLSNAVRMLLWKLFHFRQNCSKAILDTLQPELHALRLIER